MFADTREQDENKTISVGTEEAKVSSPSVWVHHEARRRAGQHG